MIARRSGGHRHRRRLRHRRLRPGLRRRGRAGRGQRHRCGSDGSSAGAGGSAAQAVVDEIRSAGGEAVTSGANVADWDQAAGLIGTAIEHFGGLDVLVNNAGIVRDRMIANTSEEEFDAVVAVHLKGTSRP